MTERNCRCGKACRVIIKKRRDGARVPTTKCYLDWLSKEMAARFKR